MRQAFLALLLGAIIGSGAGADPDVLVNNLEQEDGSNLLLEDNSFILLES